VNQWRVVVVGLGKIGLPLAVQIAGKGRSVGLPSEGRGDDVSVIVIQASHARYLSLGVAR